HLGVHADHVPALRKPAVGAGDDILLADDAGVVLDAPGHQLRVLDYVSGVANDARNQDLAVWQLDVLPDHPLVFVARIGGFDGIRLGVDFQNQVDDVFQRDVAGVGRIHAAPAQVVPHAILGNAAQGVVVRLDVHLRDAAQFLPGRRRLAGQ